MSLIVKLSVEGMEETNFPDTPYKEFIIGNPEFKVEYYGDGCYVNRETGCTFQEEWIDIIRH
jgi:hypothetical protein